MGALKVHQKCYIFLMLILMFAYGWMFFFEESVIRLRWIKESLHFKHNLWPVNNLTSRHPLVPPYPYPYKFIFSQADKCKDRKPFLLLMVLSDAHDIESRNAIRDTWGNVGLYDVDVLRIFLVGLPTLFVDRVQTMLKEENLMYKDIVQQDFMDTYYNLTLKTLMGMEWVTKFCSTVSYVMKADSDTFLNVDYLVHKLLHPELPVRQNYFTGDIVAYTRPLRDPAYKWYVPKEVYPNNTYPPYCSGPGYLFSADMAKKIYDISQVIRVMPMEDAFMGICLYELQIPPTESPPDIFYVNHRNYDRCLFHNLVSVHHYSKDELRRIWSNFWKYKTKGC
ncbi:beta-1,3-galactosyltransferase 2-like [Gastrophryne carolinensis]